MKLELRSPVRRRDGVAYFVYFGEGVETDRSGILTSVNTVRVRHVEIAPILIAGGHGTVGFLPGQFPALRSGEKDAIFRLFQDELMAPAVFLQKRPGKSNTTGVSDANQFHVPFCHITDLCWILSATEFI